MTDWPDDVRGVLRRWQRADYVPCVLEKRNAEIERLRAALQAAKEKLIIFRKETSGEYKGGMEYRMLMDLIDAALEQSSTETRPADDQPSLRSTDTKS